MNRTSTPILIFLYVLLAHVEGSLDCLSQALPTAFLHDAKHCQVINILMLGTVIL